MLFAVNWYEHKGDTESILLFSILTTTIETPTTITTLRTYLFLDTPSLCGLACGQFRRLSNCFTIFLVFKILSVTVNLGSLFGLVYMIRKRQFDLYDVSVLT